LIQNTCSPVRVKIECFSGFIC